MSTMITKRALRRVLPFNHEPVMWPVPDQWCWQRGVSRHVRYDITRRHAVDTAMSSTTSARLRFGASFYPGNGDE